jgi:hypothetical protein
LERDERYHHLKGRFTAFISFLFPEQEIIFFFSFFKSSCQNDKAFNRQFILVLAMNPDANYGKTLT